ncbi:MAG: diguanylate cyclase, partial [Chloroflexota bacterium]|nr:diguanylate cyclase [Chloroflexota bacterium]
VGLIGLKRLHVEEKIRRLNAELSSSEARFRGLFEHAPVSLWEEDFSAVRQYINDLHAAGVVDLSAYFDAHPEEVAESAARVKIVDVNRATLKMFQAESKAQLLVDLSKVLGPESLTSFKEELLVLARGDMIFETELINYTLRGERRVAHLHLTIAPGCEQTWAKVFVGISAITERRQIEEALRQSEEKYRSLVERLPAITYISAFDEAKTRLYVSPQNEIYLGFPPAEWLADPDLWRNQLHPEHSDRVLAEAAQFYESGEPFISEYCTMSRDGRPVWFHDEAVIVRDAKGQPQYIQGIKFNITERKQAEEALRQSEERFRLLAWATTDAVWDWDLQTGQIWWGAGLQKIFHYSSETEQTDYEWWHDHIHPEDKYKVDHSINQALELGMEFWSKEYRFQRVDGIYADIMDRAYITRDEAGKAYRMIGAMMDITERKQAEETIRYQHAMLSSLHKITLDLLRYREINPLLNALVELAATFLDAPYAEIMLVEGETLVVQAVTQNQHHLIGDRAGREDALLSWQAFDTREPAVLSDYANWPNRRDIYNEFLFHAVADFPILNDERCLGVLALGRDKPDYEFNLDQIQFGRLFANLAALVLNSAQLREALREQSIRDPLTGLYNRRYMEEALKQHLKRVTRQLHPLGVIMLDIDHFKNFNDTHGHAAGDALLRELGRFLQSHIRGEDVACRYGGEEFLLIMPDASLEAAYQRAEHLRVEAKGLRAQDNGQSLKGITLSLGVAVYPEHGRNIDSVLRAADAALYRAKQEGRDRVAVAEKAG